MSEAGKEFPESGDGSAPICHGKRVELSSLVAVNHSITHRSELFSVWDIRVQPRGVWRTFLFDCWKFVL